MLVPGLCFGVGNMDHGLVGGVLAGRTFTVLYEKIQESFLNASQKGAQNWAFHAHSGKNCCNTLFAQYSAGSVALFGTSWWASCGRPPKKAFLTINGRILWSLCCRPLHALHQLCLINLRFQRILRLRTCLDATDAWAGYESIGNVLGLYWDNGKENANYYSRVIYCIGFRRVWHNLVARFRTWAFFSRQVFRSMWPSCTVGKAFWKTLNRQP